jgi:hypothetical protein
MSCFLSRTTKYHKVETALTIELSASTKKTSGEPLCASSGCGDLHAMATTSTALEKLSITNSQR